MNMKKGRWKVYAAWIAFTEAVGAAAGLLTREDVKLYEATIRKPPLSPPGWVFPVVWSLLYALMSTGAARISLTEPSEKRRRCLRLYLAQLGLTFLWPFLFFGLQAFSFAFFWLVLLWALLVWMTLSFRELDRPAAYLQIPYLVWVFFAGYLNFGVWILNGS